MKFDYMINYEHDKVKLPVEEKCLLALMLVIIVMDGNVVIGRVVVKSNYTVDNREEEKFLVKNF